MSRIYEPSGGNPAARLLLVVLDAKERTGLRLIERAVRRLRRRRHSASVSSALGARLAAV